MKKPLAMLLLAGTFLINCDFFYSGFDSNRFKDLIDPSNSSLFQNSLEIDLGNANTKQTRDGEIPSNTGADQVSIRFTSLKSGLNLESVQNILSLATYGDATQTFNVFAGEYISIFVEVEPSSHSIVRTFFQLTGADQYVEFFFIPAIAAGTSFRTTFKIPSNTKSGLIKAKISGESSLISGLFSNSVIVNINVVNTDITPDPPTTLTFTTVSSTLTTNPLATTMTSQTTTTMTTLTSSTTTTQTTTQTTMTTLTSTTQTMTTTTQTTVTTISTTTTNHSWKQVGLAGFNGSAATYVTFGKAPGLANPHLYFHQSSNNRGRAMYWDFSSWNDIIGVQAVTPGASSFIASGFNPSTGSPALVFSDGNAGGKLTMMHFQTGSWQIFNSAGASTGTAIQIDMAYNSQDGKNYIAYRDGDAGGGVSCLAANYATGLYEAVGSAGFNGGSAEYISIAIKPSAAYPVYVAFRDSGSSRGRLMKMDVTNWVGEGPTYFSPSGAAHISLAFHPITGEAYIAYADQNQGWKIIVLRYDGAAWVNMTPTPLGSGGTSYVNLVFHPSTNLPWVAFSDSGLSNAARVMHYDGSNWADLDSGDSDVSSGQADYVSFIFDDINDEPYVAFSDYNAGQAVTVMRFGP